MTICPTCKGEGLVWNRTTSFSGKRRGVEFQEFCPQCKGLGSIDAEPITSETGPNKIVSVTLKRGRRKPTNGE